MTTNMLDTEKYTLYGFEFPQPTTTGTYEYPPLSLEDITQLLMFVRENKRDCILHSHVQVRLSEGIRGVNCPHGVDSPISRRDAMLNHAFVDFCKEPEHVDIRICAELLDMIINSSYR